MQPLTSQEEKHLTPEELTDYDTFTNDEKIAFAAGFRRGRRGPANPERYARKRSERAVRICQRDGIKDFTIALDRADKELGGPPM